MNIHEYLNRIKYEGDMTPGLKLLQGLQKSHLMTVPFENLDIHYGNPIELDLGSFYRKIIIQKRGGFCYELNSLFQTLLDLLGFESKIISARVYDSQKNDFGEQYDHLAVIVTLDSKEYFVDVGFGEFACDPPNF